MEQILPDGFIINIKNREYQIKKLIGRGASSAAYYAQCRHDDMLTMCILKEYVPVNIEIYRDESGNIICNDDEVFERGKQKFIESGKRQNEIRNTACLNNQTPAVSKIFETNGTAYVDVTCYNGDTLKNLIDLKLPEYIEICLTIAKTTGYYHKSGMLCLDLKPENIFIMRNTSDDMITQLVEFIDYDSILDENSISDNIMLSYTREWAAPEQLNPYSYSQICRKTDIYTLGEIVFFYIFGRHSDDSEHRGFSKYPFDKCRKEIRRYIDRQEIQNLLTVLFRNTLRSSCSNRFSSADNVSEILEKLSEELNKKEYIIPTLPNVPSIFAGRDREMKEISEKLNDKHVLFITGVGGIGKSTIVRNYIHQTRSRYDVSVYFEFNGDILRTFTDEMQLKISTVSRNDGEDIMEYFKRKLLCLKNICADKNVLIVIDNFSGVITKEMSQILNCGYDIIIVSRNQPPKNSFDYIEISAINDISELNRLISANLERPVSKNEHNAFNEIITVINGHTLVLELIARQIRAGKMDANKALALIKKKGFSGFSDEKVGNYKDGEEIYDTVSVIVSELFNETNLNVKEKTALKVLSLLDIRGIEKSLACDILNLDEQILSVMTAEGWIYSDKRIHVHPVISETARNWEWSSETDDISVMDYHKRVIAIFEGMSNAEQIYLTIKQAESYVNSHKRNIIKGMYYDMTASYFDTVLNGAYVAYNESEQNLINNLLDAEYKAVKYTERSEDKNRDSFLINYYLSVVSIIIRTNPEKHSETRNWLNKAKKLIDKCEPEFSEKRCSFCMAAAWYFTLVEKNMERMLKYYKKAEISAYKSIKTELEIIDIVYIPAANCLFYHNDFYGSADIISKAVNICRKYSDIFQYIDKQTELLTCLLDVFYEIEDKDKCRQLIEEIDSMNGKYSDDGIYREIKPEIRNYAEK